MIKRYILPSAIIAGTFTCIGLLLVFYVGSSIPERHVGVDGGPEFSSERLEWEWMRLHDPATGRIPDGIRARELAYAASLPTSSSATPFRKGLGLADNEWVQRGPHNVGGRTRAVAIDITGEDTILAGGVSGGLWRSTDGGVKWVRVTPLNVHPAINCIVQDTRPGKTHIWYYGTGENYGNSASSGFPGSIYGGDGIFKSTDNGRTWRKLPATSTGTPTRQDAFDFVWRIAIDPSSDEDILYAGIWGSIVRSSDGGETWTEVLKPATGLVAKSTFTDVAVTSEGVVYATLSGDGWRRGIWRSTNGVNYTDITPQSWPSIYVRIVLGIAPSNQNLVYFLAETPGAGFPGTNFRGDTSWQSMFKYTYVSGDGKGDGGMWENRSANLPGFDTPGGNGHLFSQTGYDLVVKVKPDNEDVVFIGGTNLYRSTDGFATTQNTAWIGGFKSWDRDSSVIEDYSYPNHHADQHEIIFSPTNPDIMFSGCDGGVYKTTNCLADSIDWISLNTGYLTTQFYTIAINNVIAGDYTVMGGLQDNGTWRTDAMDLQTPWINTGSSDGAYCAISNDGKSLYVSKQLGRVYRVALDENNMMQASARVDPEGAEGYLFINPFALDPGNTDVMYLAGGQYLWRNSDLTAIPFDGREPTDVNWQRLDQSVLPANYRVTAIGVSTQSPSNRVYYGTFNSRVYRMDDATGNDPVGTEITGNNFPAGAYIDCIAVDPLDGDRAIVVFTNYSIPSVFMTEDGGETWTDISGNLEENPNGSGNGPSCRSAAILHRSNGTIYYVATSVGLFSSVSIKGQGTIWRQEGPNTIGNAVVDMIAARQSDGFVAIATHGSGVFSTIVGSTLGVNSTIAQAGTKLEQNYPNPVRGETTIPFTIPGTASVHTRIQLFDPRGRIVATVVDKMMEPGEHSIKLNRDRLSGGHVPDGTYFYRLQAGDVTRSRSMQFIR